MEREPQGPRGVLYFCAGALIGVPIAWTLAIHWSVWIVVTVACGALAVRYGEDFFDRIADSAWWRALFGRWL